MTGGIQALEGYMRRCFHCGTELVAWKPAIFEDGRQVGWQETRHKWCPNCLWVVGHVLETFLTETTVQ